MKKVKITLTKWNGKTFDEDTISFNLSDETANSMVSELFEQSKKRSPFETDDNKGSFSVSVSDVNQNVIYNAINL